MNLELYYTFVVLAKHLNYRKASEEIFITQPSIHQQIKKLEQHLNVKLFETIGRGIQLSENGKLFLPVAKNLIATYEDSLKVFNNKQQRYLIHLNIIVCSYVANYLLPQFLPVLFENEPNMEVSIIVKDSNIISSIEENHCDIGILKEKPYSTRINCEQVCEGKVKLIVPNQVENNGIDDELFYLNNYRILANNHPSYWEDIIDKILFLAPQADIISIGDIKVSEQLIALNQGVSYLPAYILKENKNNLLKAIEPKHIPSPVSFTYLVNIKKSPEIDRFNTLFKAFVLNGQNEK